MGIKEAWNVYSLHRTEALSIKVSDSGSWYITTPLEWGAGNWTLLVENTNQTVRAVRIRTMDGPAPKGGPPDKFRTSTEAPSGKPPARFAGPI